MGPIIIKMLRTFIFNRWLLGGQRPRCEKCCCQIALVVSESRRRRIFLTKLIIIYTKEVCEIHYLLGKTLQKFARHIDINYISLLVWKWNLFKAIHQLKLMYNLLVKRRRKKVRNFGWILLPGNWFFFFVFLDRAHCLVCRGQICGMLQCKKITAYVKMNSIVSGIPMNKLKNSNRSRLQRHELLQNTNTLILIKLKTKNIQKKIYF